MLLVPTCNVGLSLYLFGETKFECRLTLRMELVIFYTLEPLLFLY